MTVTRPRQSEPVSLPVAHETFAPAPAPSNGITVVDIFTVLLRYRMMIAIIVVVMVAYRAVQVIKLPRLYQSDAQFMPEGSTGQSQLSGLARQFGINVGPSGGDTPQFYMDLLKSRTILGEVVQKNFDFKSDTASYQGNLIRIYGGSRLKPRYQIPFAVAKLAKDITVTVSPRTAVITVTVSAITANLAAEIADSLLVQINTFNLVSRQRRAGAERAFVEKREADALSELRDAEANLQTFLTENRDFTRSPVLQLEYNRLTRAVEMRQAVYTSLASAYEQAKIEEVRDLPVITVVAPPDVPLAPESKHGMRQIVAALIAGFVLGAMIAFGRAWLGAVTRKHPGEVAEFDTLKKEAIGDLTHPWRPITRLFSRKRAATPVG